MSDEIGQDEELESPPPRRRRWPRGVRIALLALALVIATAGMIVRVVPLTDWGRGQIVARLNGLPIGPLGRLKVSGLAGDIWSDFTLQSLSVDDAQGPWLSARQIHMHWRPSRLLRRRVHAQLLQVGHLTLIRRPVLAEGAKKTKLANAAVKLPVSVFIDRLDLRVETLPAFSVERGLSQIDASLDVARSGGVAGQVSSRNLLRPADGLSARFDLGVGRKVLLDGQAHESRGGALAGVLGLDVARPLVIDAKAGGDVVQGWSRFFAYSGQIPIAQVSGVWTKAGGGMSGWASLAASSWTSDLQQALGPQLRFDFHHTEVHGPVRDAELKLTSQNADLDVAGRVDVDHIRSDTGLHVTAVVRDLSRMVAQPVMGPGRFDGQWTGSLTQGELTGQAGVGRLSWGGYALAGAGGPLRLDWGKQTLSLAFTAQGVGGQNVGGQGASLLAGLAGARPSARLDGQRLADGRYLIHELRFDGAGLSVQASGALGLLGDLGFKGQAELKSVTALRPGDRGDIQAKWSASQARAGQPWRLGADLSAQGLFLAMPAADTLLGPKPSLRLDGAFDRGVISVARADLTGLAGRLGLKGDVDLKGPLKLAADWSADAPLKFGPVALSGRQQGTGLISGTLSAPRLAVQADVEHLSVPQLDLSAAHAVFDLARSDQGLQGDFALTAANHYGPAHARGQLRQAQDQWWFSDLDIAAGGATAQGALALGAQGLAEADLTAQAGPGAFLDQGHVQGRLRVSGAGPQASADLSLDGQGVAVKGQGAVIQSLTLTASGPLAHLPYKASAQLALTQAPVRLDGVGVASASAGRLDLTFAGHGQVRNAAFSTVEPAQISLAGAERSARLHLAAGGGQVQIDAHQSDQALDAQARMTGVDLATLGEDLAGRFDADLSLSGQGDALSGTLNATLKGARSRDAPSKLALDGSVRAGLEGGRLTLDVDAQGAATRNHATVHAVLPADAGAAPLHFALDRQRPIEGQVSADGELQPIWDLFFGGERELGGQLNAQGTLAGTLATPKLTGHASIAQGLFEDAATGLKLRDFAAEADLRDDVLEVERFTGQDPRKGTVNGQGVLGLSPQSPSTFQIHVNGFQLLNNEQAKAIASGTVTVARDAAGHSKVSGVLSIDRADIQTAQSRTPPGVVAMDVIERNKPIDAGQAVVDAPTQGPAVGLDVRLVAPRHIFVRGLGLDAELSLDARVVGDTNAPDLQGRAQVVRGIYNFAGKRFDIDDTGYVDLASSPDAIKLNLSATLNDPTLTAVIEIKGTAAKPLITLTSTPTLPSDEVLSEVLFGTSAAQLSPVQAAQLAAAVTSLATGGGFDVMGGLGKLARLDRVALGGTAATGVTVSGGKYIGNQVYLELTGGARQGPSAEVDVRATKSLSIVSQVGGDLGAMMGLRWHRDYGVAGQTKAKAQSKPAS